MSARRPLVRISIKRETAKKIRAVNIIAQKWFEYMYRPNGMTAKELAQHYQLLWAVREEMRQFYLLYNLFIYTYLK